MRLDWAILANYAELTNGLVYIMGGGINRYQTPDYPGVFTGCLVLRFAFHPSEITSPDEPQVVFPVEVRIVDEDGTTLGHLHAATGMVAEKGFFREGGHSILIVPVVANLLKAGDYRIDMLIAGSHAKSLTLHAIYPPTALPPPPPPPPQEQQQPSNGDATT